MQGIGFFIICFGAMCADSENLLIPIAIVAVGSILVLLGNKLEEHDDDRA